ncbi:MAG: PEP-CTERM sorting domain-containing protein [Planctomycetota bacterium]
MKKQLLALALGALAAQTATSEVLILDTFDSANTTSIGAGINTAGRQSGTLATGSYGGGGSNNNATTVFNNTLQATAIGTNAASGALNQLVDLRASITAPTTEEFTLSTDLSVGGSDNSWSSFYLTTHNGDERGSSQIGILVFGSGVVQVYAGTVGGSKTTVNIEAATITSDLGSTWDESESHLYELVATPTSSTTGTYTLKIDGVEITGAQDLFYNLGPGNDGASAPGFYNLASISLANIQVNATYDNWQAALTPEPSSLALLGIGAVMMLRRRRS